MGERGKDYVLSGIIELDDAYLGAASISNAKSFLLGTYHGIGKKHLQRYFDEFDFRFNRRFWPKQLFPRLVRAVAVSKILGYGDLTR